MLPSGLVIPALSVIWSPMQKLVHVPPLRLFVTAAVGVLGTTEIVTGVASVLVLFAPGLPFVAVTVNVIE